MKHMLNMLSHAALVPVIVLDSATAETLLTQEQALKIIFPKSESVSADTKILSAEQRTTLEENTGLRFPEIDYPTFIPTSKRQTHGYAVILNEIDNHENLTFILGIHSNGKLME